MMVVAAVAGTFSFFEGGIEFVLGGMGGVAIGLSVGWMISYVRRRTEDAYLETTLALFTGYATFRPKNSGPPAEEPATPVEATAVYRAAFEVTEEAGPTTRPRSRPPNRPSPRPTRHGA